MYVLINIAQKNQDNEEYLDSILDSFHEKTKIPQRKKTVYIETNERIRDRAKIYEDRERKNRSKREEDEYWQKIYEQNRLNMREKMRNIKQFMKDKDNTKINEAFFEKYKKYFEENGIKSYNELLKLINNYDKENSDFEKELIEKYKKNLKIEKQLCQNGENGFSIVPPINKFENIEITDLDNNHIYYPKNKKFKKELQQCNEINEIKIIPDMKQYINEKMKTYEINNNRNENEDLFFIRNKKFKYNDDTELKISSNIIDIILEKEEKNILSKGDEYTENGIPIKELIDSKIKKILSKLSENDKINYQKVEQIMQNIKNKNNNEIFNDLQKKNYCIDCNQDFNNENKEECLLHNEHNFIQIEKNIFNDLDEELNIDINELDFNDSLNKIYIHLKKEQNKILKHGNNIIINFYADLLFHLYEIIVNNNSIEDLNESIIKINDLYKDNIESKNEEIINNYFKNYFLFYTQRITKLSYLKLKKIEKLMADLIDINNEIYKNDETNIFDDSNESDTDYQTSTFLNSFKVKRNDLDKSLDEININNTTKQLENEENKKYFLRLGLDIKFKYGKVQSISELYNKAKEDEIEPKNYEEFIKKELNIIEQN